jgi:hypothetical protein
MLTIIIIFALMPVLVFVGHHQRWLFTNSAAKRDTGGNSTSSGGTSQGLSTDDLL